MTTLKISAKCSDLFDATLSSDKKGLNGEYSGYVPKWLPNTRVEHYGDYVQLEIDVATGKILNWQQPTLAQLRETFPDAT